MAVGIVASAVANAAGPVLNVTSVVAHWHGTDDPAVGASATGSVVEFNGCAYRNNARVGSSFYLYNPANSPETPMYAYCTGDWADGMVCKLTAGTQFKIIEWKRGTDSWRETVLTTVGQTHTINLSDLTTGPIVNGPLVGPLDGVLLERDDTALGTYSAELTLARPLIVTAPASATVTVLSDTSVRLDWTAPYQWPDFEVRIDGGSWIAKGSALTHTFSGLTTGVLVTMEVRTTSPNGVSTSLVRTATPTAPTYDPLALPWRTVFWADDPGQSSKPSDGTIMPTSWNQPGTNTTREWVRIGTTGPLYITNWRNNRPAVGFIQGQRLNSNWEGFDSNAALTVVVVGATDNAESDLCDTDGTADFNRLLVDRSGGAWRMYRGNVLGGGTPNSNPHLFVGYFNGSSSTLKVDGTQVAAGDAGSNSNRTFAIGSSYSNSDHVSCKIAFAGVINRALTAGEQTDLLTWAQGYYAF